MIKAQAKVCGVIVAAAAERSAKDNSTFLSFPVKVLVAGSRNASPSKEVTVSVTVDGTASDIAKYPVGSRISAEGTLNFRKRGENLYLNFHADTVNVIQEGEDAIEGVMEFKGTVGAKIEAKNDKKGKPFVSFSAFSTEKNGETFEFTWVRFIKFDAEKPMFLLPKAKIEAKGELALSVYNDRLSIECRFDEIKPWEKLPFNPLSLNEEVPF